MGGVVAFNPFDKPIGQLTPADLDKLIEDQVVESWTVEYKSDFDLKGGGKRIDGGRIAKNVASFANSPLGAGSSLALTKRTRSQLV